MFPVDRKTEPSICFITNGQSFQTLNQRIGQDFEVFRGNQKLSPVFEKRSHMSYNTWLSYVFCLSNTVHFWSHIYF